MPPVIVIERLIEQGVAGARRSVTFIGDKERNTGIPKLQHTIGALERILDNVEQEGVVEDFEELVVADACGALPLPFVAPEQFSIDCCGVARECRQQVHAIGRIAGSGAAPPAANRVGSQSM
jgi:hypothetical protein